MSGTRTLGSMLLALLLAPCVAFAAPVRLGLCPVHRGSNVDMPESELERAIEQRVGSWPGISGFTPLPATCNSENVKQLIETAKAAKADRLVLANVDREGGAYALRLRVVDGTTGEAKNATVTAPSKEDLADTLANGLCDLLNQDRCVGTLRVDGPANAKVILGKHEVGETPFSGLVPIGSHPVHVVLNGKKSDARDVTILYKQETAIAVEMRGTHLVLKMNDLDALPDFFSPDDLPPVDATAPVAQKAPAMAVAAPPTAPAPVAVVPPPAPATAPGAALIVALPPGFSTSGEPSALAPSSPRVAPTPTKPVPPPRVAVAPPPAPILPIAPSAVAAVPPVPSTAAPTLASAIADPAPPTSVENTKHPERTPTWVRPAFITSVGATGALLITGVICGAVANSSATTLNNNVRLGKTTVADRTSYDSVHSTATAANVAYAFSAVAAVTAGVILGLHPRMFSAPSGGGSDAGVSVGIQGAAIGGSF